MKMKTTPKLHWIAALFVLASSTVLAGPVGTLNTFTAGTAASAAQVNSNFDTVKAAVNDNDARITPLETTVTNNSASIATIGTTIAGLQQKHTGAVYRWAVFSTYSQVSSWYANNNPAFFGGVNPSTWTDGQGHAAQMSADKEVLRTLFTQKGYGGKNALVYADEWYFFSSTNGKMLMFYWPITILSCIPAPVSMLKRH